MDLQTVVPKKMVGVRLIRHKEAALVARWVEQGRREGVFRSGPRLDAAAVLRYQENIRRSGWEYRCFFIEDGRTPIGYLDYRYRKPLAEILGLYLENQFRYKCIGRHVLRWAIADLRELGCREVRTEVYAGNIASIRADYAVGFQRDLGRDRVEDGKPIFAFRRLIAPFVRLGPPESCYKLLQGKNLYLYHVAVAEAIADRISNLSGVEIVLGLGSLSRGFADEWSDVDIAVLGRGHGLRRLWRGERSFAGLSIDLFVIDLDAAPPSKWDSSRRQDARRSRRALSYSLAMRRFFVLSGVRFRSEEENESKKFMRRFSKSAG